MGFVHVRRTVGRGINSRPYLKEGAKTDARVRDIPIGKLLEPVLKEALREMQPNSEGLIFYDHVKKSIISTSQVNCLFRRICEKAGLEMLDTKMKDIAVSFCYGRKCDKINV